MVNPQDLVQQYFGVFIQNRAQDLAQRFHWAFSNSLSDLTQINFEDELKEGRLYILDSTSFPPKSKIPKQIHGGVFAMLFYGGNLYFPAQETSILPYIVPSKHQTLKSTLQRNFNFELDYLVGGQIDVNKKGIEELLSPVNPKRFQSIEEMMRQIYQ